jgi:hypothetical protein
MVGVATLAVGIGAGAFWAGLTPGQSVDRPVKPMATEVQLEKTASTGANPFLVTPVGQDQDNVVAPSGSGGEFKGDTPGLYGDTGDKPSCDAQGLVASLQADPARAGGWAQAVGINAGDIPGYVNSLNPVVLRADTAVTEYGYQDGTFSPYAAVLQAGTAAFVNGKGEPRVKCFSGNPLSEGEQYQQVDYVGPTWQRFAPTTVTYVQPADVVVENYIYVDVYRGHSHPWHPKPWWPGDDGCFCKRHPDSPKCPGHVVIDPTKPGGGTHKPDPVLEKAAAEAKQKAEEAGKLAKEARERADDKSVEARIFDTEARNLEREATDKAAAAAKDPNNPALQKEAKEAADKAKAAREQANEKANQAKYADAAAKSSEGTQDAAQEAAKKAQEEADKAAGRQPAGKDGKTDGTDKGDDKTKNVKAEDAKDGAEDGTNATGKPDDATQAKVATPLDGKTGTPADGKTGTPTHGKTGTPADGKTGTPADGKAGTTGTGGTGTTGTGTGHGGTGKPGDAGTGNTGIGKPGTTGTGTNPSTTGTGTGDTGGKTGTGTNTGGYAGGKGGTAGPLVATQPPVQHPQPQVQHPQPQVQQPQPQVQQPPLVERQPKKLELPNQVQTKESGGSHSGAKSGESGKSGDDN